MKRYKIGNKIITADSATQAVKIAKLLDDKATFERRKEAAENFSTNKRVLGNILDLVKHDKDLTDDERKKLIMTINGYLNDLDRMSDSVKDDDFSKQSKQGFKIIEKYKDGGRIHAILKRANDFVVAYGYDEHTGEWAQGRYDNSTLEAARDTLKSEKPYATRIFDSIKDEASPIDTVNSLVQDELSAIDSYNVAIKNLEGKIPEESLAAIKAIRDDEQTHVQNLYAVINGNVTAKNLEH